MKATTFENDKTYILKKLGWVLYDLTVSIKNRDTHMVSYFQGKAYGLKEVLWDVFDVAHDRAESIAKEMLRNTLQQDFEFVC